MTGCKSNEHAETCIKYMWGYIKQYPQTYTLVNLRDPNTNNAVNEFEAIFVPAMRNIDFGLGFFVDRHSLDEYFNTETKYYSLHQPSIGYTGVNIKMEIQQNIVDVPIQKIFCDKNSNDDRDWNREVLTYGDYLNLLKPEDRIKKINKKRYNTFLVFQSGRTIMSATCSTTARDSYNEFVNIIRNNVDIFEEKLEGDTDEEDSNESDFEIEEEKEEDEDIPISI
jgi:hypothetical protein